MSLRRMHDGIFSRSPLHLALDSVSEDQSRSRPFIVSYGSRREVRPSPRRLCDPAHCLFIRDETTLLSLSVVLCCARKWLGGIEPGARQLQRSVPMSLCRPCVCVREAEPLQVYYYCILQSGCLDHT